MIERLFFFQPLNRFARRALVDNAELLCDEKAVQWTGSRLGLASCLATVAEWHLERRSAALPRSLLSNVQSQSLALISTLRISTSCRRASWVSCEAE